MGEQISQQRILNPVSRTHDLLIAGVLAQIHFRMARRMKHQKLMADQINEVEIDGKKVRLISADHRNRRVVQCIKLGQPLHQLSQPRILLQPALVQLWHKKPQQPRINIGGTQTQVCELLAERRRINTAGRERPFGVRVLRRMRKLIRNVRAVDRLGGKRTHPAHHTRRPALLGNQVPQGLDLAALAADGLNLARFPIDLRKTMNPVFVGIMARRKGRPQDRRQVRLETRQIARGPAFNQTCEHGHVPRLHQRQSNLPIGSIPTDQQQLLTHVL